MREIFQNCDDRIGLLAITYGFNCACRINNQTKLSTTSVSPSTMSSSVHTRAKTVNKIKTKARRRFTHSVQTIRFECQPTETRQTPAFQMRCARRSTATNAHQQTRQKQNSAPVSRFQCAKRALSHDDDSLLASANQSTRRRYCTRRRRLCCAQQRRRWSEIHVRPKLTLDVAVSRMRTLRPRARVSVCLATQPSSPFKSCTRSLATRAWWP